jgi:hypothetical protein
MTLNEILHIISLVLIIISAICYASLYRKARKYSRDCFQRSLVYEQAFFDLKNMTLENTSSCAESETYIKSILAHLDRLEDKIECISKEAELRYNFVKPHQTLTDREKPLLHKFIMLANLKLHPETDTKFLTCDKIGPHYSSDMHDCARNRIEYYKSDYLRIELYNAPWYMNPAEIDIEVEKMASSARSGRDVPRNHYQYLRICNAGTDLRG